MSAGDPLLHAQALIRCPSVTPDQAGALDYMEQRLARLGFACRRLRFGEDAPPAIDNLYARLGTGAPHLCFAGHVDVVPPGDAAAWTFPPFEAALRDGVLYGRGAVDMKGAIAAMLAAVERRLAEAGAPEPQELEPRSDSSGSEQALGGSISFLLTADEEGPAVHGTRAVVEWLRQRGEAPDHCILGEPTHPERMGEAIKVGRRGSLNGHLTVRGVQGHVAYPHRANNPLTGLIAALKALTGERLDEGSAHFERSNLEVTSVDTGNPTVNVIPAAASARFNVRFNDLHDAASLEARLRAIIAPALDGSGLAYELVCESNADSFVTRPGPWIDMLIAASQEATGIAPRLSTDGGTSDARFIKDICPVVEYGLVNKTIHAVDERTPLTDLAALTQVYEGFLRRYFGQ